MAYGHLAKCLENDPTLLTHPDNSVRRILRLKFMLGLFENSFIDTKKALEINGCTEHVKIAEPLIS